MEVVEASLPGVLLLQPPVHRDARGWFRETWREQAYRDLGLPPFVQDNVARSARGVLRGLHYQHPNGQAKLVSVLEGSAYDVAVDIRVGSPTFGRWAAFELSADNGRQLYVPEGFAHGYLVASEHAVLGYKVTAYHDPDAEGVVAWDDPELGIAWPIQQPVLSDRDGMAPRLGALPPEALPQFDGGMT